MKIHYFQRYHAKENVATANTMLLLSRLYRYSQDIFFSFLNSYDVLDSFAPEIVFDLQYKGKGSVPDAVIYQDSFKIVVETKLPGKSFSVDQLNNHLNSFDKNEKHKILISLAREKMDDKTKREFDNLLRLFNEKNNTSIVHLNTTFEEIANKIQENLDSKDYEMQEILNDYIEYCSHDNLIPDFDSWKYMRMQLSGVTFDFNISENVYYDNAERGFRPHTYLGLYRDKSVRAIGKIVARIAAVEDGGIIKYETEFGDLTEERIEKIQHSFEDGDKHGYNLRPIKHMYFFVDKFYETNFKKVTKRAPMGSRIFDLTEILGTDILPKETNEIAELLANKTWE